MSDEGCLSGHYWNGSSICSRCGARLHCACGQFMREDSIDEHMKRCPLWIRSVDDLHDEDRRAANLG
jgi:hypothetical protein